MHQENRRKVENVILDIAACAILHNIAIDAGLPDNFDGHLNEDQLQVPIYEGNDNHGAHFREHLINSFFS